MSNITIRAPKNFSLKATVLSHGWVNLAPYSWKNDQLYGVWSCGDFATVIRVAEEESKICILTATPLPKSMRSELSDAVRYALSFDFPATAVVEECVKHGRNDLAGMARKGWGRMLRGLSPWEDAAKTLLTTNCHWQGTQRMVAALCQSLGTRTEDNHAAFPSAETVVKGMAVLSELGLGYRAEYLTCLAKSVSTGALNLSAFVMGKGLDIEAADDMASSLRGFGPYAGSHLLVLLGWHDRLPVDREVMKYLGVRPNKSGRIPKGRQVTHYAEYGQFRFTAYKLERILKRNNWIGD